MEITDRLDPFVADLPAEEAELVAAASALVPILSANADTADRTGTLPGEDLTAMHKAGLLRLATPRIYGGAQAGASAVTAIAAELARGCSSAGWVLTVFYSGGLAVWMFPDEVRRRVWAGDPDATVCGASGGAVPARPVDGGYVLSGRWGWASGAHHASWAILDVTAGDDRGFALVPVAELSIENTWHMTGMRGTGSDTLVADDVFVPQDQVLLMSRHAGFATDLPRPQGLMGTLSAPVLGMGMALYDHIVATLTAGRPLKSGPYARAVDAPGVRSNVADAAMLIDSAILQSARSARLVDRAARAGEKLSPLVDARIRMDNGFAARQIRRAADKLLDVGGASRFAESDPAQRIWRDLGTAMRHPAYITEIDGEKYADLLLTVG
ncbi:acyl-CoA dehydrogenase family protein [Winogradskya consettensis]|uniref:Acyl-CoA dehydrogenase n=1 Tax=Winogradskya consettensis TaxID=113560 RepID=A0A919SAE8_9ACTN|nr:acyl-CoA dehydrogenase family protein [Actinoplanes consettensis]GIM67935.1 acyl-CoA dehydrogenase [Actinoplanes consettensis]